MKKQKLKKEQGITLVSIVVTVIIMLILVGVTLNVTIGENGLLKTTQEAKEKYQIESIKEQAIGLKMKYYDVYDKEASEEIITKLATISVETQVDLSKLTLYYDKATGAEYVFYLYDKTTIEEREKLEEKGIKVLLGDNNAEGFLTNEDLSIVNNSWDGTNETALRFAIGDINADSNTTLSITLDDTSIVSQIIKGNDEIEQYYEKWYNKYENLLLTGVYVTE